MTSDISANKYEFFGKKIEIDGKISNIAFTYLWQLKTVVFLHWCLKHIVLLLKQYEQLGKV